jgi:hypothetical protein
MKAQHEYYVLLEQDAHGLNFWFLQSPMVRL